MEFSFLESLLFLLWFLVIAPFTKYNVNEKNKPVLRQNSYANFIFGNSDINLNQKENTKYNFIESKSTCSLMLFITENHLLGVKLVGGTSRSSGFVYSYLYNFQNKSFLRFGLYFGKGAMTIDNRINYKIGDYIVETNIGNYPSFLAIISREPNEIYYKQKHNFHEITPSISYEYPITDNGYYLAGEIFYSYKKFSQKNKIPYNDTILLNGNEIGFQVGVSRRL